LLSKIHSTFRPGPGVQSRTFLRFLVDRNIR
jgi:hypothetical protein